VGFSIYNPLPKTSGIKVAQCDSYAENLRFYIYAFKNPDKEKRAYYICSLIYDLLTIFQFTITMQPQAIQNRAGGI
jgi:hypothetical protein